MTANMIKLLACIFMLGDHVAWKFIPATTPLGFSLHLLGRITCPVMAYFIAEGYFHTHDLKRYIGRLIAFAAVSQIPFMLYNNGELLNFNVIFSLLLGLLALSMCKQCPKRWISVCFVVVCCIFALYCDWVMYPVLWILAFGLNRGSLKKQMIWFCVIAASAVSMYGQLFQLGLFLAVPLLLLYNGQRGRGGKFGKWGFYVFYPANLLGISLLA